MRCHGGVHSAQQTEHRHVGEGRTNFAAMKEVAGARGGAQELDGRVGQGNAMLAATLHATGWHCPDPCAEVDFVPSSPDHLACSGRRQDRKPQSERRCASSRNLAMKAGTCAYASAGWCFTFLTLERGGNS